MAVAVTANHLQRREKLVLDLSVRRVLPQAAERPHDAWPSAARLSFSISAAAPLVPLAGLLMHNRGGVSKLPVAGG